MIKLLFLHGLESSPQGAKVQYLRGRPEYRVAAPALDTRAVVKCLTQAEVPTRPPPQSYAAAAAAAREAVSEFGPDVVVGSSFGGGLCAWLAGQGALAVPLVLLAPAAWSLFGVGGLVHRARVAVVHGRQDEVVPFAHSRDFVDASRGDTLLWAVDDEHRLMDTVRRGVLDEMIHWALVGRR